MAMQGNTPPRPRAPGAPRAPGGAPPRAHNNNWVATIVRAPYTLALTGLGFFWTALQAGVNIIAAISQHVLPPPLHQMLRCASPLALNPINVVSCLRHRPALHFFCMVEMLRCAPPPDCKPHFCRIAPLFSPPPGFRPFILYIFSVVRLNPPETLPL